MYPPAQERYATPIGKTLQQAQSLGKNQALMGEPFDCVLRDSDVESQFAHDCSFDERVKFFFKLPRAFKISTPLGAYNPDWAVLFEGDKRVNFVAETKSSLIEEYRRLSENLKIACGRKHFGLSGEMEFQVVTKVAQLANLESESKT